MDVSDSFARASAKAKSLPASTTNAQKLQLYGLYKQATVGPPKGRAPSVFDAVGHAKWKAWNEVRQLTVEQAMHAYCDLVGVPAPSSEGALGAAPSAATGVAVGADVGEAARAVAPLEMLRPETTSTRMIATATEESHPSPARSPTRLSALTRRRGEHVPYLCYWDIHRDDFSLPT
jgi:diazepam-binding inhibitor (GABA receptor modulator, acyl-CoA-binding protein)